MDFSNESRNLQIASYLQTLRLEQDLTLEQLSHLSQVPIVHLTSIEEGRFGRFDEFYLKMYLRRYTKALDVDLEQLYVYASQQPLLEDEEQTKKKKKENERQMTRTQADISATVTNVEKKKQKRKKSTIRTASIARIETKNKVKRFIVGLILITLLIAFVVFLVRLIRDLPENGTDQTAPPLDNPHLITTPYDEVEETEPVTEPATEPEMAAHTIIEFYSQTGNTQTFDVLTSEEEIEFVITFSALCWLELRFNDSVITDGTYNELLEESLILAEGEVNSIHLRVGYLPGIESIQLNGEYVEFEVPGDVQSFQFNIELE